MDALLEDVPDGLATERLILRSARGTDAPTLNAAVCESLADLRAYMPWAQSAPSLAQSDADCRRLQAKFLLREGLSMFIFERAADGSEGEFVGGTGLHRIDWKVGWSYFPCRLVRFGLKPSIHAVFRRSPPPQDERPTGLTAATAVH